MNEKYPIRIRAGDLKPVLPGLAKVIARNATLPVLQCVKVEILNRRAIRLTATDLDLHFSVQVPAETAATSSTTTADNGGKQQPFLVPLNHLRQQVQGARADESIGLRELPKAIPVVEFPEPDTFRATPLMMDRRMKHGLLQAFECASRDETRYVLQGAYLEIEEGGQGKEQGQGSDHIVATDGRHLFSQNSCDLSVLKQSLILPAHKGWTWKGIMAGDGAGGNDDDDPWQLRVQSPGRDQTTRLFRIDAKHWSMQGRCIDGNYPNWRQVLPPKDDFKTKLLLRQEDLGAIVHAIGRQPGAAAANKPIGLRIDRGTLSLLAHDAETEQWQGTGLPFQGKKGPDVTVFMNRDYLTRALRFGLREIDIVDADRPLCCRGEGRFLIIMPVRADAPGTEHVTAQGPSVMAAEKPHRASTAERKPPQRKRPVSRKTAPAPALPEKEGPVSALSEEIPRIEKALRMAARGLASASAALKAVRLP